MGYSVYITRSRDWWDEDGPKITREEWRAYIARDPELRLDGSAGADMAVWSGHSQHENPWIGWSEGILESKHPDPSLIEKMVAVAGALGAKVQGEDGEVYLSGGRVRKARPPRLVERVRRWLSKAFATGVDPVDPASLPFGVGDRVHDGIGNEGTVTRIDVCAEGGLGEIKVQLDDGRVLSQAAIAHGLEPVSRR